MRTIIAGSRDCTDMDVLKTAIADCGWAPTVVISGTARGVDQLGESWAEENKIPCEQYPANWNKYGKSAGYHRNVVMADKAEALIAIWDGKSKGTQLMIHIAKDRGLKSHVHLTHSQSEDNHSCSISTDLYGESL